jgi:hypothetical protein
MSLHQSLAALVEELEGEYSAEGIIEMLAWPLATEDTYNAANEAFDDD